ncbi:MAG: DUF4423 domain-containing protein [Bdellovibrionaceae bacterium]|nr:DUF4423 domain-containing protein [Pseudobdellovibrionaceae bacterium]
MSTIAFAFKSYKVFLKKTCQKERGLLTRLAAAGGCELSYLSKCLSSEINITTDQAYKIAVYLRLKPLERKYFLALVELERAGDSNYKAYLQAGMDEMIKEYEDLSSRTTKDKLENSYGVFSYHASWLHSAIHILVSIPEYQTINSLCQKLQIHKKVVLKVIEDLVSLNYIHKTSNEKYEYLQGGTHTSKESPLVVMYHQNWRQKAIIDSQNTDTDGIHYTNVQSMTLEDFNKIKNLILETIEKSEKIAGPSLPKELVNMNIDLFRV